MNKILFTTAILLIMSLSAKAQEKLYDVVIIGGGLSGLTSAHYLETDNFLILEKEEKAGGRIIDGQWNNFHYPKGTEYVGEPDGILKSLISDLNLSVHPVTPPTDGIGYKGTIYSRENIFDFLPTKKDQRQFKTLHKKLSRLDKKTEDIVWENQTIGKYKALDNITVKQWLEENNIHPLIQRYINIENLGLFGANNGELSMFYNIDEMAYDIPSQKKYNESEVFTFPNGMIDLSNALKKEYPTKLRYNTEVISVDKQKDNTLIIRTNVNGKETVFKSKRVICTTPAPIAKKIFKNSISENALKQLSKIDYGQYITINIFTEKRWLKDAWTISCLDNYFTSIYDVTRNQTGIDYNGKSIVSAYIPSTTANDKTFINQSNDEILQKTLKDMELYFPNISKSVLDCDIQRFKYAYPVFGLGYYELLQSLKNDDSLNKTIFLAGDYMRYAVVDGAILSGYLSAKKINKTLIKK